VENFLTNRVVEAQDGKERASPSLADHVQRWTQAQKPAILSTGVLLRAVKLRDTEENWDVQRSCSGGHNYVGHLLILATAPYTNGVV
jgi:hypothetical protein